MAADREFVEQIMREARPHGTLPPRVWVTTDELQVCAVCVHFRWLKRLKDILVQAAAISKSINFLALYLSHRQPFIVHMSL